MRVAFKEKSEDQMLTTYHYDVEFSSDKETEKYLLSKEDLFDEITQAEFRKVKRKEKNIYYLHIKGKINKRIVEIMGIDTYPNHLLIMLSTNQENPFSQEELEAMFFKEKED